MKNHSPLPIKSRTRPSAASGSCPKPKPRFTLFMLRNFRGTLSDPLLQQRQKSSDVSGLVCVIQVSRCVCMSESLIVMQGNVLTCAKFEHAEYWASSEPPVTHSID
jgi:hypothetical protein